MKKKSLALFVLMLFIVNSITIVGTSNATNNKYHTIGDKGGVFRQLPALPDNTMPSALVSDTSMGLQVYEDFWGVTNPICHIHWWGQVVKWENDTWYPGDPEGMVFDITFFEDDNGEPGTEIYTFSGIAPINVGTGIMYDYSDEWQDGPFELYHFEADLGLCFDITSGWVSIISKNSPTDSVIALIESSDGNGKCYHNDIQQEIDVSFILSESGDPEIEIRTKGGMGISADVTNIGNDTLSNIPVDIVVYGGILSKTKVNKRETISLDPGDTISVKSGLFLGFGKISIGIIADDMVRYTSGFQLLIFSRIK